MKIQRCLYLWLLLFAMTFGVRARGEEFIAYATSNAFGNLQFNTPVGMASPPGETNRLFVLEKGGKVDVITNLANPTKTVFMTLPNVNARGECGLLGIAFHPGFATNGYFYLFYCTASPTVSIIDCLSRFEVDPANTNHGLVSTELPLIRQNDPAENHNAGDLHFGPDGYLYVSLGDGGGSNDTYMNSQRIDRNFFSGILRLDVDKLPGNLEPHPHPTGTTNYFVPADNPFVGATQFNGKPVNPAAVRTEFWAVGLRNPWRFSFDPATGFLYCGDVGQYAREEIDIITKGGNYGWNYREGNIARPGSGPPPAGFSSIDPILAYPHGAPSGIEGDCVIGGVVSHGNRLPWNEGAYIFGDYVTGCIYQLRSDGTSATDVNYLTKVYSPCAFGIDPSNGDVLIASLAANMIKRLTAGPDIAPPTPRIVYPTANLTFSNNPVLAVRGTAVDNLAVATVWIKINDEDYQLATGQSNWTANVNLATGTNVLMVKAVDTAGNESQPVTTRVFYSVTNSLTVLTTGLGTVTPNRDGQILQIGRSYPMTAVPGPNYAFSNWVGGDIISNVALLRFMMQTDLVLTANFVPNPYLHAGGTYNGLFSEASGVVPVSAGLLTFTVATNGNFNGRFSVDGDSVSVVGKFDIAGNAIGTASRKAFGKTDLTYNLTLNLETGADQMSGTVSGGAWISSVTGYRVTWGPGNPATVFTNFYTMLLPPSGEPNAPSPDGYGYATATVDLLGKLTLSGAVSDGLTLSQTIAISKDGEWPFYVPLYVQPVTATVGTKQVVIREAQGLLTGWMQLIDHTPTGTLTWIKPGWTNLLYTNIFTNTISVLGSRQQVPPSGHRVLDLTNGTVTLSHGGLNAFLTNAFILKTNNAVTFLGTNYNKTSLPINTRSGSFRGTFVRPGATATTVIQGAILQDQNFGAGFFVGTNESGTVLLQKAD